jgi:hypothetical protein
LIDIESQVFHTVANKAYERFPNIFMTGEYVKSPPSFPAVSLMEMDNTIREDTVDSGSSENHANVMYELNVYSNKTSGKKSECKEIIAFIDAQMLAMGFVRVALTPVPNEYDSTIYRMVARYRASVSANHSIFRR